MLVSSHDNYIVTSLFVSFDIMRNIIFVELALKKQNEHKNDRTTCTQIELTDRQTEYSQTDG